MKTWFYSAIRSKTTLNYVKNLMAVPEFQSRCAPVMTLGPEIQGLRLFYRMQRSWSVLIGTLMPIEKEKTVDTDLVTWTGRWTHGIKLDR